MLLITIALIYSLFRGAVEGMIHVRPGEKMHRLGFAAGIRAHVWHKRYYHFISATTDILAAVLGIMVYRHGFDALLYSGIFFVGWEIFEISNNYARMRSPLMRVTEQGHQDQFYEYINFFDIVRLKLWGKQVIVMHVFRIITGMAFLVLAAAI